MVGIPGSVRELLAAGSPAHVVTIDPDGEGLWPYVVMEGRARIVEGGRSR